MENCLVTKLKGTVDNNNLLKFGESILCSVKAGALGGVGLYNPSSTPASVRTANGGILCNSEGTPLGVDSINLPQGEQVSVYIQAPSETDAPIIIYEPTYNDEIILNIASGTSIYPSNLTGDISPYFKYRPLYNPSGNANDRSQNSLYLNIDNIRLSDTVTTLAGLSAIHTIEGNIENLFTKVYSGYNRFLSFQQNSGVYGNLVNIIQYLPNIQGYILWETNITCNIESLASVLPTTVATLLIGRGTHLSGAVETFCETMLSRYAGESKTLIFGVTLTDATLNGNPITATFDYKIEFSANSIVIKNNSNDDIVASYNGSTWIYA